MSRPPLGAGSCDTCGRSDERHDGLDLQPVETLVAVYQWARPYRCAPCRATRDRETAAAIESARLSFDQDMADAEHRAECAACDKAFANMQPRRIRDLFCPDRRRTQRGCNA